MENIWNIATEIYKKDQQEMEKEISFQDYATPLIREKFKIRFDFSFQHLSPPEIKNYIEELREEFKYPESDYQELFNHLNKEHGLILHESEMNEIIDIVLKK